MNGRTDQLKVLAKEFNEKPPQNPVEATDRTIEIIRCLIPFTNTGLHKEKDQIELAVLKRYIDHVKDDTSLTVDYENDYLVIKNITVHTLAELAALRDKQKFALELSKNVYCSQLHIFKKIYDNQNTLYNSLQSDLKDLRTLMQQFGQVIATVEEKKPQVENKASPKPEIGEEEQPGMRLRRVS